MRFINIGWQMLAAIIFCVGIGWLIEWKWPEASPWSILGFSLFGVVAAIYLAIRQVSDKK